MPSNMKEKSLFAIMFECEHNNVVTGTLGEGGFQIQNISWQTNRVDLSESCINIQLSAYIITACLLMQRMKLFGKLVE